MSNATHLTPQHSASKMIFTRPKRHAAILACLPLIGLTLLVGCRRLSTPALRPPAAASDSSSRAAAILNDVLTVQTAVERYRSEQGHYPVLVEGEQSIGSGTVLDASGWTDVTRQRGTVYFSNTQSAALVEPMLYQGGSGDQYYRIEFRLPATYQQYAAGANCALPGKILPSPCASVPRPAARAPLTPQPEQPTGLNTTAPGSKSSRKTLGNISLEIPSGAIIQRIQVPGQDHPLAIIWIVASANFDQLQQQFQKQEISQDELMRTGWAITMYEELNPERLGTDAWADRLVSASPEESSQRSITTPDGIISVRAQRDTTFKRIVTRYYIQRSANGNIIMLYTFEPLNQPFAKEIDSIIRSIRVQ